MKDFVYEGIPASYREVFWQKCTGLMSFKCSYCPDYYYLLTHADRSGEFKEYPNKHFAQVDKDMDRTYPGDPYYTPEVKASIRRIFRAYIWRNHTVGYFQSMNYLVFRLRKVLSEEDTFWVFCIIIESYMPPDFYIDMYGATTHATIMIRIFEQYNMLPQVLQKFEDMQYPIINYSCQFFLSLFTICLPEETSMRVLDIFLLEGLQSNKLLFDVSLAYLKILAPQLITCNNFSTVIDPSNQALQDPTAVMQEIKKART